MQFSPLLPVVLLLLSSTAFGQIYAEVSSGYSFTLLNPNHRESQDVSSKVDSSFGRDHQITFSGNVTSKIRYLFRVGINQQRIHVFYSKAQSQSYTEQIDGRMSSKYLSLMAAPIWHRGRRLEFSYGLGFYAGLRYDQRFDGIIRTIETDYVGIDTKIYTFRNVEPDSYRALATGLFTTFGLNYAIVPRLRMGLSTDLILFLQAKNLIFQDTGNTNEANFRLGITYRFDKRIDDLER